MFDQPTILVARPVLAELRNFVKRGPATTTGRRQSVFSDAGSWAVSMTVPLYTPDMIREWRAMIARLRQGEEIRLRWRDPSAPAGARGGATVTASGAHALGATELDLAVSGVALTRGTLISVADRLYEITEIVSGAPIATNPFSTPGAIWGERRVWGSGTPGAPIATTVKILPPLRSALADEAAVSVDWLQLSAELDEMNSGDLDFDRLGVASIAFNEI